VAYGGGDGGGRFGEGEGLHGEGVRLPRLAHASLAQVKEDHLALFATSEQAHARRAVQHAARAVGVHGAACDERLPNTPQEASARPSADASRNGER
jgi:hypothetical protein